MTNKKMSYVSAIDYVLAGNAINDEVRERLEALHASLIKRNTKRKPAGPTKAQIERAAVAEKLFAAMEAGKAYTNAEAAQLIPELEGASAQKVSAAMKLLGDRVSHDKVKGKVVYTIA